MDTLIGLLNLIILSTTLFWLIKYTKATEKMKDAMVRQTNLQYMPVIMLYVRDIRDYMKIGNVSEYADIKREKANYLIRIHTELEKSNYYLALRNTGSGSAFNVSIKSNKFDVNRYQSNFLAPSHDEQPFSIVAKKNIKFDSWDDFKGAIVEIICKDVMGVLHTFKFRIVEIENKRVEFVEKL